MANNQAGPYRRPTRAAVEQALTTLAVEYIFLAADDTRSRPRDWGTVDQDVVRIGFSGFWEHMWKGAALRKLNFALGRICDIKGEGT